jgi:dinuclear metal center YbgI/SA1388 family protein
MITLGKLTEFLNNLMFYDKNLPVTQFDPHMANGLVYKGEEKILKIGFGVSASIELFKKAVVLNCQTLIVHHAFNFPGFVSYDRLFQNRYSYLVKNNLSLFGYHFLLDSHPEIGHNISIIKKLGGKVDKPFLHKGAPWGYMGTVDNLSINQIKNIFEKDFSPNMIIYPYGPEQIKRVVVISGRGTPIPSDIQFLLDNKVDLFITGEDSEWIREIFHEVGIHYVAGGHYYTERFGLLSMEKIIKKKLSVETEFIELINNV